MRLSRSSGCLAGFLLIGQQAFAQSLNAVLTENSGTLSTLISLLTLVPDVVTTLSSAQNITILAPSDTAFADLLARNPRSAELMRNPRALAGVLQYHVLQGRVAAADITATPRFVPTLLGSPFANVTGGQRVSLAAVNGSARAFSGYKQMATVVTADIAIDGGSLVHVIDTVLTVPASPGQTASNTGLTSLVGALTRTRLADPVNALSDVTIFAPSNAGFQAIGSALANIALQDLANVLGYHVLAQQVRFSPDLLATEQATFTTLQGTNLTVRRDDGQLFVNSARVVVADVITANGVVHVLDNVLNPGNNSAVPDPALPTQVPAFAGVTPVLEAPFAAGVSPTATFVPAVVPLSGAGRPGALSRSALLLAGGMALWLSSKL